MASGGDIRYARCAGGIDVAYKVMGGGPIDSVFVSGFVSHLDLLDDVPFYCNPVDDMARFARVVIFDSGTGLSDRSLGFGSLADRMLATVLFTDIVSSTETDVRVGDRRWRELLDRHDDVAKSASPGIGAAS